MSAQAVSLNTTETTGTRMWRVVAVAAVGTTLGWYCFFIFGGLTAAIGPAFFPKGNSRLAELASAGTFGVAFVVRLLGAILFGAQGDRRGRKRAVVRSSLILAAATVAAGLLPQYQTIGVAAPVLLILLRVIQGLALGGQHGLVSVYVAEHAPPRQVGFYVSFIQLTVTLGLLFSLGVIFVLQTTMARSLLAWSWRIPFVLAIVLLVWSFVFERTMRESAQKAERSSQNIVKLVLIGLFGATASYGVLWYVGQFHTLFFLRDVLKVETGSATNVLTVALVITLPFFVLFGWLSDRFGPRKIIMVGCLFAVLSFYPAYRGMAAASGVNVAVSIREMKNPATGGVRLQPVSPQPDGTLRILAPASPNSIALFLFVFSQTILVAIIAAPMAAYLVQLSPVNIRCLSFCLSYQLGSSVFGAAFPLITLSAITSTHSIYGGLLYPAAIVLLTFVVSLRSPDVHNASGKN